jgi:hypothetical protein
VLGSPPVSAATSRSVVLPARPHARHLLGADARLAERQGRDAVALRQVDVEVPRLLPDVRRDGEPVRRPALADVEPASEPLGLGDRGPDVLDRASKVRSRCSV